MNIPRTKRPKGQYVPRDKTSQGTERPKGQNVPKDKTSHRKKRPKEKTSQRTSVAETNSGSRSFFSPAPALFHIKSLKSRSSLHIFTPAPTGSGSATLQRTKRNKGQNVPRDTPSQGTKRPMGQIRPNESHYLTCVAYYLIQYGQDKGMT